MKLRFLFILLALAGLDACSPAPETAPSEPAGLTLDIRYHTLDNGLKVVLAPDPAVPTATVAVYYHIGFRIEPRDRTGFAHLFEHMMFEGSANLPEGAFDDLIQGNGGVLNGSTRFDFTNYFEVVPANQLERVLWAEADRMAGLAITETNLEQQKGVVANEVKVNVLNRPYGGFPWLWMPQVANENWYNAHNFYGELGDLEAATLGDVETFFNTFYAPNNAALVVAGDFDPAVTLTQIERYFGRLSRRELPPKPDISEPEQTAAKREVREDPLAPRPALAFAYHVPERNTPDWYAMLLLSDILASGAESRLYQKLVQEEGLTGSVSGSINDLGSSFSYDGPMLWTASLFHDRETSADIILAAVDTVITDLQASPVAAEELNRARTKFRSGIYDLAASATRFGLVDLLACFALFDDDPTRLNRIEDGLRAVTPADIQRVAQTYLAPNKRTVLEWVPKPAQEAE